MVCVGPAVPPQGCRALLPLLGKKLPAFPTVPASPWRAQDATFDLACCGLAHGALATLPRRLIFLGYMLMCP